MKKFATILTFMEFSQLLLRGVITISSDRCVYLTKGKIYSLEDLLELTPFIGLSDDSYILCHFFTESKKTENRRLKLEQNDVEYFVAMTERGARLIKASTGFDFNSISHLDLEHQWNEYCKKQHLIDTKYKMQHLRDALNLDQDVLDDSLDFSALSQEENLGIHVEPLSSSELNKRSKYIGTVCYGWLLSILMLGKFLKAKAMQSELEVFKNYVEAAAFKSWVLACYDKVRMNDKQSLSNPLLEKIEDPIKPLLDLVSSTCSDLEGGLEYCAVVYHYGSLAANEETINLNSLQYDLRYLARKYDKTFSSKALYLIASNLSFKSIRQLIQQQAR